MRMPRGFSRVSFHPGGSLVRAAAAFPGRLRGPDEHRVPLGVRIGVWVGVRMVLSTKCGVG